jgi:hypothetical protein
MSIIKPSLNVGFLVLVTKLICCVLCDLILMWLYWINHWLLRGGRCEGIIIELKGNQEFSFVWGLDKTTNNQVKFLALIRGLMILEQKEFNIISMIQDSSITICHMHYLMIPQDTLLSRLVSRT